jgi:hypothetical protein
MGAEKRQYDAISGVRVIMSVWVILLHVNMLITVLTHDSDSALIFNTLPWVNALKHFGCQVDGEQTWMRAASSFVLCSPLLTCVVLVRSLLRDLRLPGHNEHPGRRAVGKAPGARHGCLDR